MRWPKGRTRPSSRTRAASADPNYNGLAVASVTVHITDNDTAGGRYRVGRRHGRGRGRRHGHLHGGADDGAHGQRDGDGGQRRAGHSRPDAS